MNLPGTVPNGTVPNGTVPADAVHADAVRLLRGWAPSASDQRSLRDRYVRHLELNSDGLYRTCVPDHLTASTMVVSADGTRVLLTLHAKARRWFQLGGHLEPGDRTLADAAAREAREESGIDGLLVHPLPVQLSEHEVPFCRPGTGDPAAPVHHLDVRFAAVAPAGAEATISAESLDLRWWALDALPDEADDDLRELALLARDRLAEA